MRTCSLRRTSQKTFLEPICDDCLLLELGLAQEIRGALGRNRGDEHGERSLRGAEWLLESNVEITVEPAAVENDGFATHSEPSGLSMSSGSESVDETPMRGRGRRRAMEINRASLVMGDGSPLQRSGSSQRHIQTNRPLRRARKLHDLKRSLTTDAGRSDSSSARPFSWIEHLKSDLGQRIQKKRPEVGRGAESTYYTGSSNDASSSSMEDESIPSLHSIPPAASGSFGAQESIMLALNQVISSSEFDASHLSSTHPSDTSPEPLQPGTEETARQATSPRSLKSFDTAALTVSPSSSPVTALAGSSDDISLHPLSCPLPTFNSTEETMTEQENQKHVVNADISERQSNSREGKTTILE